MALFGAKKIEQDDPDAKPASVKGDARVILVIGAPDSDYTLIGNSTKLLGIAEFEKTFDLEKLNYDLLKTLKLDSGWTHLMPDNWEKNDLLDSIKDEMKQLITAQFTENKTQIINSSNLARTGNLWAEVFTECGVEPSFLMCFTRPNDNYLGWLVYNLEAEKNSRSYKRSFVNLQDFLGNWRKILRKSSNDLELEFGNWLSTTREQEVENLITTRNVTILPQEKKQTPLNVKRLYSALSDAANGRKYDETVTEEILPDIKLFFAPLIQKNVEVAELKTRLSKIEAEVVELRDRILQPDDDFYEPALEDGTIENARADGEKLYLKTWREWAQGHKNRQDLSQYPLFSLGAPLADEVADVASSIPRNTITIVDVMSPPITSVGTRMDGKVLRVVPISPYANEFNLALQQAGIKPPVPVVKIDPENLVLGFGPRSVDILHCREAIEYTKNPVVVIMEMLNVMKDDGAIFLSHQVNKASEENFATLAQWNCVEKGGQFIIWNSWYKFNITRMLAGVYDVEAKSYFDFVEVVIRKKK